MKLTANSMASPKRALDARKVAGAIADTLRRDFESIDIVDVHVAEHVGQDGEEQLRVEVVFEGDLEGDDYIRVARAPRRLESVLEKIGTDRYPLLYFVSKADYDRGRKRSARR
jgi:hypothetical protein